MRFSSLSMPRFVACAAVLLLLTAFAAAPARRAAEETYSYGYDELGRLDSVGDGASTVRYRYDAAGNLLQHAVLEPGLISRLAAALVGLGLLHRRKASRRRGASSAPLIPRGTAIAVCHTRNRDR